MIFLRDTFQVLLTLPIDSAAADMVIVSPLQTQRFAALWVKGSNPATVPLALLSDEVMSACGGP